METVVVVLMILVCFNFMMKQTFRKRGSVAAIAVVATLFVGLMWPYAIQQSKTQIADWLANVQLMLDTSTLSKILCKWKQDSVVSLFLYLDSVFKNKHKLVHNQAPV